MGADLLHSHFDLLELRFSTEYWPWDVKPDKPYAFSPLPMYTQTNINIIKTQNALLQPLCIFVIRCGLQASMNRLTVYLVFWLPLPWM